jgi:hypothetical protein
MTPERRVCPPDVYAPVDATGGTPSGSAEQLENPQQDFSSETSLSGAGQFSSVPVEPPIGAINKTESDVLNARDSVLSAGEGVPDAQVSSQKQTNGKAALDTPLDPLTENRALLPRRPYEIIGKPGFRWRKELSEGGQKLYYWLLTEAGDIDGLPGIAAEDNFDLDATLEELRGHGLLDESDPDIIMLVRRRS